ncbi:hypothetical protein ACLVWU_12505 [Bdellovibrio sp. HCB290]|uniref:hypothetical protein n=1 Tax=Bdellovibrio sp. HCB290 TaxID=3394356 RepID=UPI0039B3F584
MMKILSSLLAMFISNRSFSGGHGGGGGFDFKKIQAGIIDDLALRLRKPVTLILLGICATFFFCGGLFMAIIDATLQFDRLGTIYGTATLWTGVVLAAITAGGYIYIFTQQWPGAKNATAGKKASEQAEEKAERMHREQRRPSDLDGALAELLMDFVDGRKARRERRFSASEARRADREARRAAREARREHRKDARNTEWPSDTEDFTQSSKH